MNSAELWEKQRDEQRLVLCDLSLKGGRQTHVVLSRSSGKPRQRDGTALRDAAPAALEGTGLMVMRGSVSCHVISNFISYHTEYPVSSLLLESHLKTLSLLSFALILTLMPRFIIA